MTDSIRPVSGEVQSSSSAALAAVGIAVGYGGKTIIADLDLDVPPGQITIIIGPNGCGKSTLLRALARLAKPMRGTILLDGRDIHALPTRQVARRFGLLPQLPLAPEGIAVADLVARGRSPHQSFLRGWSLEDEEIVAGAMKATSTLELAQRSVDSLSGGQRQRVWIAMALAQQTDLLLLDEPTTFLDLAHQLEILNLLRGLNRRHGRTMLLVLHDLNLASRYADHIVAMRDGQIICQGSPQTVITAANIEAVFGLGCVIVPDPVTGTPIVIPKNVSASI